MAHKVQVGLGYEKLVFKGRFLATHPQFMGINCGDPGVAPPPPQKKKSQQCG